jgi:hypothetical protein
LAQACHDVVDGRLCRPVISELHLPGHDVHYASHDSGGSIAERNNSGFSLAPRAKVSAIIKGASENQRLLIGRPIIGQSSAALPARQNPTPGINKKKS